MKYLLLSLVLILGACSSDNVIYRDKIVHVNVPVVQPCASPRPTEPESLKNRFTEAEWGDMDIVQRLAHVGSNALLKDQYGKDLNAATGACPEID